MLAALNKGLIKEVARHFFNLKVDMIRIATQDQAGSQFTTWRIVIVGPFDDAVIEPPQSDNSTSSNSTGNLSDSCKSSESEVTEVGVERAAAAPTGAKETKCPFGFM